MIGDGLESADPQLVPTAEFLLETTALKNSSSVSGEGKYANLGMDGLLYKRPSISDRQTRTETVIGRFDTRGS